MSKSNIREVEVNGVNFCFKYLINLGNNKFGSMTIDEKTDLYR